MPSRRSRPAGAARSIEASFEKPIEKVIL